MEDSSYVKKLLHSDDYIIKVAEQDGKIAGIISADIDRLHLCAEITDCLILPINSVFKGRGYRFAGRLVNNCFICEGFEDMNIWEKMLY